MTLQGFVRRYRGVVWQLRTNWRGEHQPRKCGPPCTCPCGWCKHGGHAP